MKPKIFIDGASGTTGLQIKSLLQEWEKAGKISLIEISDRRDENQRRAAFAQADLTVLCLPDDAARDTIPLLAGTKTKVLDASSAHRTAPGWVYGLPELDKNQSSLIAQAQYVSNPGCFATGAISILKPLMAAGIVDKDQDITIVGVTGYSSGGKKMIKKFESCSEPVFAAHSINTKHKHVAEIKAYSGLNQTPVFLPYVVNTPRGMMVSVAFNNVADPQTVHKTLEAAYNQAGSKIRVAPLDLSARHIDFDAAPSDTVTLYVAGWDDGVNRQVTVHALLDNLGKGAASQALQNIALMLKL